MAIKRLDPNARFRVVAQNDDAIEFETNAELLDADGKQLDKLTRYEEFIDTLDISKLKFKEGMKPTVFHVRALTNFETADLNEKYFTFDQTTKKVKNNNHLKMLLDMFNLGCLGIEKEDGSLEKITGDDVGFSTAVEIGGIISLIGNLGKNLKKR